MTLSSLIRYSLIIASLSIPIAAAADDNVLLNDPFSIESEQEVVTGIKPDPGPIEQEEKKFAFDWNQHTTIAESKKRINEAEQFIAKIADISKLNNTEQQALGLLLYKLGAYYTNVAHAPDTAIPKLTVAKTLLTNKEDKVWSLNQLAYAYEQKYATTGKSEEKEKAFYYVNKVLSELLPNVKDKPAAFAYYVKGLLQSDTQNYQQAIKTLQTALAIYEAILTSKDDQYIRTKNQLAVAMLKQSGKPDNAIAMLKQVKQHWLSAGTLNQNPYAANSLLSLGEAYLKIGKNKAALTELKTAVSIFKSLYGDKSTLLTKPYQLLAQAYKGIGRLKEASSYEKKANVLDNA